MTHPRGSILPTLHLMYFTSVQWLMKTLAHGRSNIYLILGLLESLPMSLAVKVRMTGMDTLVFLYLVQMLMVLTAIRNILVYASRNL